MIDHVHGFCETFVSAHLPGELPKFRELWPVVELWLESSKQGEAVPSAAMAPALGAPGTIDLVWPRVAIFAHLVLSQIPEELDLGSRHFKQVLERAIKNADLPTEMAPALADSMRSFVEAVRTGAAVSHLLEVEVWTPRHAPAERKGFRPNTPNDFDLERLLEAEEEAQAGRSVILDLRQKQMRVVPMDFGKPRDHRLLEALLRVGDDGLTPDEIHNVLYPNRSLPTIWALRGYFRKALDDWKKRMKGAVVYLNEKSGRYELWGFASEQRRFYVIRQLRSQSPGIGSSQ